MRNCLPKNTSLILGIVFASATICVFADECAIEIEPIRDSNMIEVDHCLSIIDVDDSRLVSLFDQAMRQRRDDLAAKLLEHGVEPGSRTRVVALSASAEMPLVLEMLLDMDASLVYGRPNRVPPLASAALGGSYRAAHLLLDRGADPDTALLPAVQMNHLHIAHLLIERGARVESLHAEAAGKLLGAAVSSTNFQFVDYLLQRGLDPNLRDEMGVHVLEYAQVHEDERMGWANWKTLIAYGADPQTMACSFSADRIAALQDSAAWYRRAIRQQLAHCAEPATRPLPSTQ